MRTRNILTALVLAGLLLSVVLAGCSEHRAVREKLAFEASTDSFVKWGSDIIFYSDDKSTETATIEGNAGDASFDGDLAVGAWVTLGAATAVSVTEGMTITAAGTYQPLTSAAAVTTSAGSVTAGTNTGDLLLFENQNAADVITIDGTGGNVECKANVALGAGDTLLLIWDGADWQCVSGYDNS